MKIDARYRYTSSESTKDNAIMIWSVFSVLLHLELPPVIVRGWSAFFSVLVEWSSSTKTTGCHREIGSAWGKGIFIGIWADCIFQNVQQERKRKPSRQIAQERSEMVPKDEYTHIHWKASDQIGYWLRRIDDQRAAIANVLESHLSIRWRRVSYGCRPEILLFHRTNLNSLKPFWPQTILLLTGDMEGIVWIDRTHDVYIEFRWMSTEHREKDRCNLMGSRCSLTQLRSNATSRSSSYLPEACRHWFEKKTSMVYWKQRRIVGSHRTPIICSLNWLLSRSGRLMSMNNYYCCYWCGFDWAEFESDIDEVWENRLERTGLAKTSIEQENSTADTEDVLVDAVSNRSVRSDSVGKLDERFVALVAAQTDTVVFDRSGRNPMDWWAEWRPWLNYSTEDGWITREYAGFPWTTIVIDWSSSFSARSSLDFVDWQIHRIPDVNNSDDWERIHSDSTGPSESTRSVSTVKSNWAPNHVRWTLSPSRSRDTDWRTFPADRCSSESVNVTHVAEGSIPIISAHRWRTSSRKCREMANIRSNWSNTFPMRNFEQHAPNLSLHQYAQYSLDSSATREDSGHVELDHGWMKRETCRISWPMNTEKTLDVSGVESDSTVHCLPIHR